MQKIVVLTGAGISAESGIKTFRDSGGLWEEYDIMEVASIQGWHKNPKLVLDFYNARRKQLENCLPNSAHYALVSLEQYYSVNIITQNVDDLHERAGSTHIMHLHGELKKSRSTTNPSQIYPIKGSELNIGDTCSNGSQLRPDIVWFGEEVPLIPNAIKLIEQADILIIIGTSLNVYPAANLIHYASKEIPKYYIDLNSSKIKGISNLHLINEKASVGVTTLCESLMKKCH